MKKRMAALVSALILVTTFVLAGCGQSTNSTSANEPTAANPLIIKVATGTAPTHPENLGVERFKELVEKASNGRVKVEDFPNGQLGSQDDYVKDLQNGTLQATMVSVGFFASYGAPVLNVIEIPYLSHSPQQALQVIGGAAGSSPVGQKIMQLADAHGVQVLAFWDAGLRELTNNKHPVKEPSDLKGLKIRVPPGEVNVKAWDMLGANAAPLAYTELYLALKQGVFDGQENPPSNIYNSKLYEVQKYLSLTNHMQMIHMFMYSGQLWNKLPPDIQKIISDAAVQAGTYQWQVTQEQDSQLLQKLEAGGMKVNQVDINAFKEKLTPLYADYEKQYGADAKYFIDAFQAVK